MRRPAKLSPAVKAKLIEAMETGLPIPDAAAVSGISLADLGRSLQQDERLNVELREAEARGIGSLLRVIEQAAARGDRRAARWLQKRRRPAG